MFGTTGTINVYVYMIKFNFYSSLRFRCTVVRAGFTLWNWQSAVTVWTVMLHVCPLGSHPEQDTSVVFGPTIPKLLHCPQSPDVLVRKPPTPPRTAGGFVQLTVNSCEGIGKLTMVLGGGSGTAACISQFYMHKLISEQ